MIYSTNSTIASVWNAIKSGILPLSIAAALAGCSTTPIAPEQARPVPLDRVRAFQNRQEGSARLTVIRDAGFLGSGCYLGLYVNGVLVARFDTSEKATFFLPAGEVILAVANDPEGHGLCSAGDLKVQRETVLHAGEEKRFRLTIGPNGTIDVMRTDL